MIQKLDNTNTEVSKKIQFVFNVSYAVEAKLLKAINFPPLKRPLESYVNSTTAFFGYFIDKEIAGIIDIDATTKRTHINSLVVHPKFFRNGVASNLMEFVFSTFDSELFTVETGLENGPATNLYKKFGFIEVKQWNTDHGIRKVKFERKESL